MRFGSHLYGTALPTSDEDYKGIYIPESKDIILQRVRKTINQTTKPSDVLKNRPGDIDFEIFAYSEFIKLLLEGQTGAMDMLFAPARFYELVKTGPWSEIIRNKEKFLHKGTSSFVGYCRTQAAKYGLKGGRIATLRAAIELLNKLPPTDKLILHWDAIVAFTKTHEHTSILEIESKTLKLPLLHWDVCNCKMGQTVTAEYAVSQFQKIFDAYGERARLAEKNLGVDWKALMHAVRVCEEAKELLLTGHVTFPRPEAPLLLQIRKQELPYKEVAEMIERGLDEVEEAKLKSKLPEKPDFKFAEDLIFEIYKNAIDGKYQE